MHRWSSWWRQAAIEAFLRASGSEVAQCLQRFRHLERLPARDVEEYQRRQLLDLLRHCRERVPWYRQQIESRNLDLSENFQVSELAKLPVLTKDTLRDRYGALRSDDAAARRAFENSSGGSTGEPVVFLQDRAFHARSVVAAKLIYNEFLGKLPGEPEVDLWGAERDLRRVAAGAGKRLANFVYNRRLLDCFLVDDEKLGRFVAEINRRKPVSIWAYAQSLDLLAKFIRRQRLEIHSPRLIISTAGTLHEAIRDSAEEVFRCPVYNQYGCRELGAIAFEMQDQDGLRGLPYLNHVEIVEGRIVVTSLTNWSMPLLRYDTGDIAEPWTGNQDSRYGCRNKVFRSVTGRVHSHFRTARGGLVYGGYFAHQFFYMDWVRKFQIVQESLDHVTCRLVLADEPVDADLDRIGGRIRRVMGADCLVEFRIVESIAPSPSGKHMYTVCDL